MGQLKLRLVDVPAVMLALVGAAILGLVGCKKPQPAEEPERVFEVKRFPRLNPKDGLLGTWEWGFDDTNYSLAPEHWKLTIPEQMGVQEQFKLHADSSWEWERTGKKPLRLSGPRFTTVHVDRDDGYGRRFIFDSLTLIDAQNRKATVFYYELDDTCMVESGGLAGKIGGPTIVYYLRGRE